MPLINNLAPLNRNMTTALTATIRCPKTTEKISEQYAVKIYVIISASILLFMWQAESNL